MMKIEAQILNSYWGLLSSLAPSLKLKLIEMLSQSINMDLSNKEDRLEKSFGAWVGTTDSEEIIHEIRENRTFNRQIEIEN